MPPALDSWNINWWFTTEATLFFDPHDMPGLERHIGAVSPRPSSGLPQLTPPQPRAYSPNPPYPPGRPPCLRHCGSRSPVPVVPLPLLSPSAAGPAAQAGVGSSRTVSPSASVSTLPNQAEGSPGTDLSPTCGSRSPEPVVPLPLLSPSAAGPAAQAGVGSSRTVSPSASVSTLPKQAEGSPGTDLSPTWFIILSY